MSPETPGSNVSEGCLWNGQAFKFDCDFGFRDLTVSDAEREAVEGIFGAAKRHAVDIEKYERSE